MEEIYKKIGKVSFGLLSPREVKRMASVKVVTPELYDKEGYPVEGGLMDARMGVIDPGLRCKTCGQKLKECLGHFGYIELARPVIHVKYVNSILNILRSVCRECGKVLIQDKDKERYREELNNIEERLGMEGKRKKIKAIMDSVKNIKKCPHCKEKQYTIKLEKPTTFLENDKRLSALDIRNRFEKIPDDELFLLGMDERYAKPFWLVIDIMPIPPVTIRPSITLETGERSEDDLTHKLGDIVRINQRLFENINAGAPEIIVEDLWDLLQYHITTYFDNTLSSVPPARHRSGQTLKTLTERIKSKEGRFRYNLAGKRVNFSARSVISPDPEIMFNEVGIPKEVAMELTIPERVRDYNIKRLKAFVERGPTIYPGSNYVIRPDGKKKRITDETKEQLLEELEPGYVVERHLMDGDIAIFNRQPSLHRMSIMCHKIRVIPGRSFRLNPDVCFPYNADFDGDEMNLHIPQTEESRSEAEVLMQVQTQLVSPKHGLNVIGCIEDAVSGNYLLTKDMIMNKEEAINLLISVGIEEGFRNFKKEVSGKDVFSVLLPKEFSYIGKSKGGGKVVIKEGMLIEGVIDSESIGEESGGLFREYYKNYGADKTLDLMGKMFKLGINTLLMRGFTTSIDDTDLNEEILSKIKDSIKNARKEIDNLIEDYKSKKLEALPSKTKEETLEAYILKVLNSIRNKIGDYVAGVIKEENHTGIMARSGARGGMLSIAQMAATVGQQALGGRRIENGYDNRTLSLFRKGDLSPVAKGFVENSFKSGLRPEEYFFHAMTGRDSLMDVALRTPKSGYLYRRLANALQDLKLEYDNTVRDANNIIVQFKYGEDNIDVSKSDNGSIDVDNIIRNEVGK